MNRYTLIQWDDRDDEDRDLVAYVYDPNEDFGAHLEADVTEILQGSVIISTEQLFDALGKDDELL